jgi:solute:Na+ symporter, SSS family
LGLGVQFSALDYVVVGIFAAAILALGFSAKLRNNTILQFLAAGRSLSLPAFVATLVTVWYGGILGVAESVAPYPTGWGLGAGTWLLMGVPYYLFALAYAIWFAKRVRHGEQLSIPERLASRWGKGVGLVGAVIMFCLAVPAAHVLMLGSLIQSFTNWDLLLAVFAATIVGVLFLYKGGLLADVRVGMLAFVMMFVGFIVIDVFCIATHPPATVIPVLRDMDMLHFAGNSSWLVVFTFFVLGSWTLVDPAFHQRVASTESPETGRKGVLVSIGFWMLFDVLSITAALYAVALAKPLPTDGKLLYPIFGSQILPPGLKALFFCGMLGTILSAMVGYTLVSGTTIGREIVARLKPGLSEAQVTLCSRVGIAIACAVAILLAINIKSVVNLWYAWSGCVIGSMLIPVSIAYLRDRAVRVSSTVIAASMTVAFVASFVWLIRGLQTNNTSLNVAFIQSERGLSIRDEAAVAAPEVGRIDVPIGTLVPALVISGAVIAIGAFAARRTGKNG